jgi:hypothetical protein
MPQQARGTINNIEHVAFLNMWLEKFVFYGSIYGPTTNMQTKVERIAIGETIPLGKHLLGAIYQVLHQVSARLATNQSLRNIGAPWWFIQLLLNMSTHKAIGKEIINFDFPADYREEQDCQRRLVSVCLARNCHKAKWLSFSNHCTMASPKKPLLMVLELQR